VQATPGRITANRMDGVSIGVGEVLKADSYVFAPGPWLGKVFPFLAASITPTRQEVFFFGYSRQRFQLQRRPPANLH